MSELSEYIKSLYATARRCFEWKPLYFNNNSSMDENGIYSDMNIPKGDKFTYIKFTIQYQSRCDENGLSHPKEGIKYYILHSLKIDDLTEPLIVPKPCNTDNLQTSSQISTALTVNNFGRFRYAFDDVETAKKVAVKEDEQMIMPLLHCLTKEDYSDVKEFIEKYDNGLNDEV